MFTFVDAYRTSRFSEPPADGWLPANARPWLFAGAAIASSGIGFWALPSRPIVAENVGFGLLANAIGYLGVDAFHVVVAFLLANVCAFLATRRGGASSAMLAAVLVPVGMVCIGTAMAVSGLAVDALTHAPSDVGLRLLSAPFVLLGGVLWIVAHGVPAPWLLAALLCALPRPRFRRGVLRAP